MPTMADIAKRAGVALSTVSHTLSGKRPVSAEVRQRVLDAIAELEYQPHALARALATKRTRTIALLYPKVSTSLPEPHFEFISSIVEVASSKNYGLLLWTPSDDDGAVLRMIQQGFIAGLVLMEVRLDDPRVEMLKKQNYPFTLIGHCRDNTGINFVDMDFDYALHMCVDYLAGLGHKHVAFINHSSKLYEMGAGYVIRSHEAFMHAAEQHNLCGIVYPCESNAQAGYEVVLAALTENPATTAIITSNAWINGGITRAIYDRGLKIPEDISLMGILSPSVAEMTTPALTTIDFPYKEMGRIGADMLIRQLEGEQIATQLLLKPSLIIRQSSGPSKR
ncbi:LacI family DNA-binding transcriptional regulator [Dictyobacter kobayashii]|uniref:LacI family transcriptional regulator n=1 Tax=Dictyobacter kobayashii TaxID=2014872 RepID=A0A402ATI4_9CHLR|nr:LacI family DNA-binding transcriptional regulator [Dictyobacter kobayashii]GCE22411.1 LacI family transcriptional regulator [Dictyobacter kobayashii]